MVMSVKRTVRALQASGSVQTRTRFAFRNIGFARFPYEAGIAETSEFFDSVLTSGAVLTRQLRTIIDVDLAAKTFETCVGTVATIIIHEVDTLAVCTRFRGTLIDIGFAVGARVSWQAGAGVMSDSIVAGSSVFAGVRCTFIDIRFTETSGESRGALTSEPARNFHENSRNSGTTFKEKIIEAEVKNQHGKERGVQFQFY